MRWRWWSLPEVRLRLPALLRRNRRRKNRIIVRARLALLRIALAGVACILLVACGRQLATRVVGHSYFQLRSIEVDGVIDPERVLAWSDLEAGMSLWAVDPTRIIDLLSRHARVHRVAVERQFPDRLRIVVDEHRPVAMLLHDPPLLLDETGRWFPPLERELREDRPYVTGIRPEELETRPFNAAVELREAARLLRSWQRHPDWPAVSEVRHEGNGERVVYVAETPMAIRFGEEVSDDQFARLSAVFELWRGREARIAAIDLSVPGQAVLRLRGRPAPGSRLRA